MGYTTDFDGSFTCTPALNPAQVEYINLFAGTRRMKRDVVKALSMPDPVREAVNLPLGKEAEYFVGGVGSFGQGRDPSILDNNSPAITQPGLWCQWVSSEDGSEIEWNGSEKFYSYIEWIKYLNDNFFKPWGIVLEGKVNWSGEDSGDHGVIIAKAGEIRSKEIKVEEVNFEDCE